MLRIPQPEVHGVMRFRHSETGLFEQIRELSVKDVWVPAPLQSCLVFFFGGKDP